MSNLDRFCLGLVTVAGELGHSVSHCEAIKAVKVCFPEVWLVCLEHFMAFDLWYMFHR